MAVIECQRIPSKRRDSVHGCLRIESVSSSPSEARRGGGRLRDVEPRRADRPCGRRVRGLDPRARETTPAIPRRLGPRGRGRHGQRLGRSGLHRQAAGLRRVRLDRPGTTPAARPAPGRAAGGSGRRCPPPGPISWPCSDPHGDPEPLATGESEDRRRTRQRRRRKPVGTDLASRPSRRGRARRPRHETWIEVAAQRAGPSAP